jgi:hypothetical protein
MLLQRLRRFTEPAFAAPQLAGTRPISAANGLHSVQKH